MHDCRMRASNVQASGYGSVLSAFEIGRPLLHERRHTFAEIRSAKQRQQLQEDVMHVVAKIFRQT
jgi:hypothetical protein